MTTTSPKIDGVEATFRHIDDIEWTEVQRQRNADGTVSVVREKWPIIRPDFLSAYVYYEPGMVVRRHGHRSNHIVFVLGGGAWIGGDWSTAGTHVHVPLGAAFGPIVAGPEGVTCWELSFGEFGGWGDEPELFEREIESRGITVLPNPPLDLGEWFKDPRGDSGADRPTPRIEGLAESVKLMDDIEWTEVKRQRNADGSISVVREKWPIADPDFMSAYIEYGPGMITRRHGHFDHHLVFVISGGAWFGDRWCPAGTHIELPFGAAFGPIIAGEEGTFFLELTDGDFRSWGDQPELFEQAIAERGVTPLPDPPIDLGGWFEDARGYWAPGDGGGVTNDYIGDPAVQAEWDTRYLERERLWSGQPNGALVAEVAGLTPGRVLDVGCGEGADAVWLAKGGWEVTALEVSGVALKRAAGHASDAGLTIRWVHAGLAEAMLPPGSFDLVSAQYPALLRTPEDAAERALLAAVAPGGILLLVHHAGMEDHHDGDFDPADYVWPKMIAELVEHDADWEVEVNEQRPRVAPEGGAGAHHQDDLVLRARRLR